MNRLEKPTLFWNILLVSLCKETWHTWKTMISSNCPTKRTSNHLCQIFSRMSKNGISLGIWNRWQKGSWYTQSISGISLNICCKQTSLAVSGFILNTSLLELFTIQMEDSSPPNIYPSCCLLVMLNRLYLKFGSISPHAEWFSPLYNPSNHKQCQECWLYQISSMLIHHVW